MRRTREPKLALRDLAVVATAVGMSVMTIVFGVATMSVLHVPESARRILPENPVAASVRLDRMAAEGAIGARYPGYRALALIANRIDPTDPVPVRSLALDALANGQIVVGDALYRYAFELSRRDYPTNVYLIAAAVRGLQAANALALYDIALRTAQNRAALFDGLARGFGKPGLKPLLARLILQNPPWAQALFDRMEARGEYANGLSQVLVAARESELARNPNNRRRMLAWQRKTGSYAEAYALYQSFSGGGADARPWDVAFFGHNEYPPFDWSVADANTADDGYGARITPAGLLYWSHGQGGLLAQKLLLLPAGRYVLSGQLNGSATESAGPRISLACARHDRLIAQMTLSPGQSFHQFDVDSGCGAYWLNVNLVGYTARYDAEDSGNINLKLSYLGPTNNMALQ